MPAVGVEAVGLTVGPWREERNAVQMAVGLRGAGSVEGKVESVGAAHAEFVSTVAERGKHRDLRLGGGVVEANHRNALFIDLRCCVVSVSHCHSLTCINPAVYWLLESHGPEFRKEIPTHTGLYETAFRRAWRIAILKAWWSAAFWRF